jgi:hypothetical protein
VEHSWEWLELVAGEVRRRRSDRLLDMASAMRAAQATTDDYKKFINALK